MSQYFECDFTNLTIGGSPATKTINDQGWEVLTLGDRKCFFSEVLVGGSFEDNEFIFFFDKYNDLFFYFMFSYKESVQFFKA